MATLWRAYGRQMIAPVRAAAPRMGTGSGGRSPGLSPCLLTPAPCAGAAPPPAGVVFFLKTKNGETTSY